MKINFPGPFVFVFSRLTGVSLAEVCAELADPIKMNKTNITRTSTEKEEEKKTDGCNCSVFVYI